MLIDLDYTGKFPYKYGVGEVTLRNQFTIDADKKRNTRFVDAGDSGSVIVNEAGQVIGLLVAANTNPDGSVKGTVGYATPINIVLDKMGVRMGTVAPNQVLIGDVNGDGKADLVWNWLGDQNLMLSGLAQANSIFKILPAESPITQGWSGYRPSSATSTVMARPTWCGTHSVVISTASMSALARVTVTLQVQSTQDHPARGWSGYQLFIGDVNGDGKADLVWNSLGGDINRIYVGLSQRYGIFDFLPAQDHPAHPLPRAGAVTRSSSATSTVMARPTWCGTHPVISRPRHRSMLALARATVSSSFRLRTNYIWCAAGWSGYTPALIGDVNGDGKADLVWNSLGGDINRIYVGLSQGNNQPYPTFQVQSTQDHPVRGGWSGYQLFIGDVNGDGKADLVWNSLGGDINRFYVGLSQAKPDRTLPSIFCGAGSSGGARLERLPAPHRRRQR